MKVLQYGNSEPTASNHCEKCNSELEFTKSDVFAVQEGYITNYYVICPVCGHRQFVTHWAREWFE